MADFFEFQESDIIFSDDFSYSNQSSSRDSPSNSRSILHRRKISKKENCSVPVNIPENSIPSSSCFEYDDVEFDGYLSDDYDEDKIVPPHVIVDRRSSDFDNFVKISRPKNLIHFRNSVLRLTGFLES
ncbi:Solute carrier family 12 member 1 [Bienertia sinuspersici]